MRNLQKPKGPAYYAERIKNKINTSARRWHRHGRAIELKAGSWIQDRDYVEYNHFFRNGFIDFLKLKPDANLADALFAIHNYNRPMRILDDGAGRGDFLAGLKSKLQERRIKTITTALSLHENSDLKIVKKTGKIDEVVTGNAEFFMPKKPFDAIFSMFGSFSYTLPHLRKDHLLKFAYSLRRGGIMMAGFYFKHYDVRNELATINKGLSGIPKKQRAQYSEPSKGLTLEKEMEGIEMAFHKRGFDAKFYPYGLPVGLPNWMLIVRRR